MPCLKKRALLKDLSQKDVEVQKIIEEILKEGGLLNAEVNATHYFVCHEESNV